MRLKAASILDQVVAANPNNAEAVLLMGEANLRTGNAQQVVASMLELKKKQPNLVAAQLLLAQAYQSLGRVDDAAAVFREQIKLSPGDPQPHLLLGLMLRQQNKIEEARQAFENAQRLAPANLLAITQLIDLDIADGRFDAALQRAQAELERAPQWRTSWKERFMPPKASGTALKLPFSKRSNWTRIFGRLQLLISTYVASNKLPQAINQVESLLSKSPDNLRALMVSASLYERINEFAKAQAAYEKLLSIKPDFPPVLNNLAYLYAERLGELDKAYDLAQRARALQPGDAAIADTLGWILYKRGDYKQALALLQESAQNLPNNPEIQFHLGMANYMMGRTEEAQTAFRQAVATAGDFPGREEAKRQLSLLEQGGGKGAQLPTTDTSATLRRQSDDPLAYIRLGESYERQGAFAEAEAAYEKAIKLNPQLLSATVKLAQLYAGPVKDAGKALQFAQKARELAPNDPKIIGILGRAAYQTGNFPWAYSLLQESAHQLTNDPKVLSDLAWAAYSLGKVSEAREAMQRVLSTASDSSQSSDANLFLEMVALTERGSKSCRNATADRASPQSESGLRPRADGSGCDPRPTWRIRGRSRRLLRLPAPLPGFRPCAKTPGIVVRRRPRKARPSIRLSHEGSQGLTG